MTTDGELQGYLQQIASADVPDVTDTSYQAQLAALGDYAQSAFNEVLAQYRFMGLLAGIQGPNDTDQDVIDARNAIIEALGEFLQAGPLAEQIGSGWSEVQQSRNALQERIFDALRSGSDDMQGVLAAQNLLDSIVPEHVSNQGETHLEGLAAGNHDYTDQLARVPPEFRSDIERLIAQQAQLAGLEDARRAARRQAIVDWFKGVWDGITSYYHEKMDLIRNGQWLLATGQITVDIAVFAAEEVVVAGIVTAIIAITGGLAVGMALALRGAVRMALSVARQGTRTVRRVNATWDFRIELRKIEPGVLYSNPAPINITATRKLDYEHDVNVQTDLTPDERLAMGEGGQGSTRPDTDSPENGDAGEGGINADDPPAFRHPRDGDPPRSNDELAPGDRIPFDKDDPTVFQEWWDDLSPEELQQLSRNDKISDRSESTART